MISLHAEQAGNDRPDTDPVAIDSASPEAMSGDVNAGQRDGVTGQDSVIESGEVDAPVAPALPDRANAPVSVVTERFLRGILTYVPLDRIVELHLFSPLRQGTTETGIAVIAADILEPDPVPEAEGAPLELLLAGEAKDVAEASGAVATTPSEDDAVVTGEAADTNDDWADAVLDTLASTVAASLADAASLAGATNDADDDVDDDVDNDNDDDVNPYADEDNTPVVASTASDTTSVTAVPPAPVHVRHTVYTARYRLVIKGPDRGKWEIDVVNEADAPLLTVETVVRGVQRRAGEATDTVRYDAVQIARALRQLEPGANG